MLQVRTALRLLTRSDQSEGVWPAFTAGVQPHEPLFSSQWIVTCLPRGTGLQHLTWYRPQVER